MPSNKPTGATKSKASGATMRRSNNMTATKAFNAKSRSPTTSKAPTRNQRPSTNASPTGRGATKKKTKKKAKRSPFKPKPLKLPTCRPPSLRTILRSLIFLPLGYLCFERLYVPLESTVHLDLSTFAATQESKKPLKTITSEHQQLPTLPQLTSETPYTAWKSRSCPPHTTFVANHVVASQSELQSLGVSNAISNPQNKHNKIPRLVHQTAPTRCLTPAFAKLTSEWKDLSPGWSYILHDENAMNRLLKLHFPEFPHLQILLRNCIHRPNGALKADLWRYLVLYAYGGIYADLDTAPRKLKQVARRLFEDPSTDAVFVVEQYHILSQWFLAVSPRHPLMYYALQNALLNILEADDTLKMGAHSKTGPHALHRAFQLFCQDSGTAVDPIGVGNQPVQNGTYVGTHNRTITVLGNAYHENEFVKREAVDAATKKRDYRTMGMTHFSKFIQSNAKMSNMSCAEAMYQDVASRLWSMVAPATTAGG